MTAPPAERDALGGHLSAAQAAEVQAEVASWPPLTAAQRDAISALFTDSAVAP